ncbi:acetyl-CoA C-acetyltransferase/3-oxo-5,6-didehydrosuberyl-CoA/3-oxoadipyl-CoA thiolase [Thermosporothrix hazakensis]|jgi:3-oxoadipyl-CoA thiolase|uniref:Acetyl-CoA C-acetyltransferase/3-oxo-5, 6-didehydrosuberyl-CoA/3-oxoadipyl-CoA thiolase n=2 Tax=Thermosporothrix TaxID=768650 RepID=A0A326U134_THEHA|nr:3-oxoadipyl-CoA thiolase [Thermosporothrix hazakensis]PZW23323.1 acetyl-CoA C-acetyltransferase/3-oxo-5,6-didehydrosuberyl-CoA/3-oxoadipyl-CoA thiolase [Thermosporothrix hazakensis]BBH89564.1 acetyl-CoA acetyltransferase [Thermosporothrix sp. COM3]GCE47750.1 acetyl-CoA acetyltransferase [Thermosporothrix hazakensis]
MEEAVILSAVRTPIGRYGGILKDVRPDDLGALVIKEAIQRAGIEPASVEDVIFGCANQAGEDNRNVARMSLLLAGLPVEVAGQTVNRLCGSGLQAINSAAHAIQAGDGDTFVAGGVESMTRAPFVLGKSDAAFARSLKLEDTTLGWRFINPRLAALYPPYSMGETAENIAERYHISREEQDAYALRSHRRAVAAQQEGRFAIEITPVTIPQKKGEAQVVSQDEHPRPDTTLEKLAALKPVFRQGGSVTAGNAAGINDGAAALVLMAHNRARALGLHPRARIVATAVAGVDPSYMGLGPIPATRKVLQRAGLTIQDIDLIELNEAFAVQVLQCIRELDIEPEKVNVNGGAIALGHPLGCSGARLMTTLLYELEQRGGRYGLATMCIGVGQGIATLIERL